MSVTATEFLTEYPEFDMFDPTVVQAQLDAVEELFCPASVWVINDSDTRQREGIKLRTAHILESRRLQMAKTASAGAAINTGQSSSASAVSGDDLEQTHYGIQFKNLRRNLPIVGIMAW